MTKRAVKWLQGIVVLLWLAIVVGILWFFWADRNQEQITPDDSNQVTGQATNISDVSRLVEDLNLLPADLEIEPSEVGKTNPFAP